MKIYARSQSSNYSKFIGKNIWVAFRDLGYKLVYIRITSQDELNTEYAFVYDYMKNDPDQYGFGCWARRTEDFNITYTQVEPVDVLTSSEIMDIYGVCP